MPDLRAIAFPPPPGFRGSMTMTCAYCGKTYPWWPPTERRRWFPSSMYAICWPCHYRWARPVREVWWWRTLARLVRIRYG